MSAYLHYLVLIGPRKRLVYSSGRAEGTGRAGKQDEIVYENKEEEEEERRGGDRTR